MKTVRLTGTAAALLFGSLFVGTIFAQGHEGRDDRQDKGGGQQHAPGQQGRPAPQTIGSAAAATRPTSASAPAGASAAATRPTSASAPAGASAAGTPAAAGARAATTPRSSGRNVFRKRLRSNSNSSNNVSSRRNRSNRTVRNGNGSRRQSGPRNSHSSPNNVSRRRNRVPRNSSATSSLGREIVRSRPCRDVPSRNRARRSSYRAPERSQQQAQAWQQQRGWQRGGAWQGGRTFQQDRAQPLVQRASHLGAARRLRRLLYPAGAV